MSRTADKDLILYGAPWCGYCVVLRKKLDDRGVEYDYRNVDDPEIRLEMNKKTAGNQTIPVLCRGEQCWVNPDETTLKGEVNV